jgi:hypothetical protein
MDVPFASLKYVLTPEDADPQKPRYEPFGVIVTKTSASLDRMAFVALPPASGRLLGVGSILSATGRAFF